VLGDRVVKGMGAVPEAIGPQPIAVLDSGVGGLSVLREIHRELDRENLLYVADQAHIPYGPRSLTEIRRLTVGVTRFLLTWGAKTVVLACNTASAAALYHLRATFPSVPFVGMEPAVKPAARATHSRVIGVMATPATFSGEMFSDLVSKYAQGATVLEQVCPGLVQQVEAGDLDGPETAGLLRSYLEPLVSAGMDTLVLGCTHYPFLARAIREIVGSRVEIIDPSPAVARQVRRVLEERGWLNLSAETGSLTSFTTDDPAAFGQLASRLIENAGRVVALRWNSDGTALAVAD
jgi:glutamate racemase